MAIASEGTNQACRYAFSKRVVLELPYITTQRASLLVSRGYSYIYPQAFYVDEKANELLILFSPHGGADSDNWVEVRDWDTGAYKTIFNAGSTLSEGLTVIYSGSTRYLVAKASGGGIVGKYDITVLPSELASVTPTITYAVDMHYEMASWGDDIFISSETEPVGKVKLTTEFVRYDTDFNPTGSMSVPRTLSGHPGAFSGYGRNFVKHQSVACGPGFFVLGCGEISNAPFVDTQPLFYQGVVLLSSSGIPVIQGLCLPKPYAGILQNAGYNVTRVENEGIWVSSEGYVYTLNIVDTNHQSDRCLLIMQEFFDGPGALNFASAAVAPVAPDVPSVYWPKCLQGGVMLDPYTGASITSLNDIMDFMTRNNVREFSFYTTSFKGVTDINGADLPDTQICTVYNGNNNAFWVTLCGSHGTRRLVVANSPREQFDCTGEVYVKDQPSSDVQIIGGAGSPEGVINADAGSLYLRTDGGKGKTLYIKESGSGTTGWVLSNT